MDRRSFRASISRFARNDRAYASSRPFNVTDATRDQVHVRMHHGLASRLADIHTDVGT